MEVAIAYGNPDDEEAVTTIANALHNVGVSTDVQYMKNVDASQYDGVIQVGGVNANLDYERFANQFNWKTDVNSGEAVITRVGFDNDVPVMGIAGYESEDTLRAAQRFAGQRTSNVTVYGEELTGFKDHMNTSEDIRDDPDDGSSGSGGSGDSGGSGSGGSGDTGFLEGIIGGGLTGDTDSDLIPNISQLQTALKILIVLVALGVGIYVLSLLKPFFKILGKVA